MFAEYPKISQMFQDISLLANKIGFECLTLKIYYRINFEKYF